MLQWFISFPEFAEFSEFLFYLGKTPLANKEAEPAYILKTTLLLIHMSHFAYTCKMRYLLNLVLESWEYLWFYWIFAL